RGGRILRRDYRRRRARHDDVGLEAHELRCKRRHALELALAPAELEPVVASFYVAEIPHALLEGIEARVGWHDRREVADDIHPLLSQRWKRQRCGEGDEKAATPIHGFYTLTRLKR